MVLPISLFFCSSINISERWKFCNSYSTRTSIFDGSWRWNEELSAHIRCIFLEKYGDSILRAWLKRNSHHTCIKGIGTHPVPNILCVPFCQRHHCDPLWSAPPLLALVKCSRRQPVVPSIKSLFHEWMLNLCWRYNNSWVQKITGWTQQTTQKKGAQMRKLEPFRKRWIDFEKSWRLPQKEVPKWWRILRLQGRIIVVALFRCFTSSGDTTDSSWKENKSNFRRRRPVWGETLGGDRALLDPCVAPIHLYK